MRRQVEPWFVAALLGILVVWGVALRLEDPLSSRAIAAEDPYTHVVFTKEWLEQGYFSDSFHLGTGMYPPGMHAFLAVLVPFTGVSLYEFARIAPALFGGLAVLGMYVLASRLANRAAGLGAAFATAIMPEHIFRTELLFPTAFDLALLPLWLVGFHMMLSREQRVAGAVLFGGASLPLAVMHPWLVPLFGVPLAVYAALRAMRLREGFRATWRLLTLPVGLIVLGSAFAVAFRWDDSDTGFADFLAKVPGLAPMGEWTMPGPLVFVVIIPVLAAAAAAGISLAGAAASVRLPRIVRFGMSVAAGAALFALLGPMTQRLPQDVNYSMMLGPVALALALAGFALAFLRPTALGDLGVSISAFLFPLTALDVFTSPYWPQRTVAYLCVGVALLAGNVAAHAYDGALLALRSERARRVAGPAVIVALGLVAAGAATASPIDTYRWYRIYNDDDVSFRGFEATVDIIEEDPGAKVFIYTWQPALLVKTLADPDLVWYSPKFFHEQETRETQLGKLQGPGYVLVDHHTQQAERKGKVDLSFLEDRSRFRVVHDDGVTLYEVLR